MKYQLLWRFSELQKRKEMKKKLWQGRLGVSDRKGIIN